MKRLILTDDGKVEHPAPLPQPEVKPVLRVKPVAPTAGIGPTSGLTLPASMQHPGMTREEMTAALKDELTGRYTGSIVTKELELKMRRDAEGLMDLYRKLVDPMFVPYPIVLSLERSEI